MKVTVAERRRGAKRRKSDRRNGLKDKDQSNGKEVLTTREAAESLKVTPQTIKNYIYRGKIKAHKTPGGRHRILRSDLIKLGYLKI